MGSSARSTTMEDQLRLKNSNPNTAKKKSKGRKKEEYEFCKVCNLNHAQGRRHNYFPNHSKSLSAFFSRFHSKLSDVRFFLKNPSPLRPEHASRNRLWCVFCDLDIDELGSSFACNNAIRHLASTDHLKNLKHFLWKYGGGMDPMDSFMISEEDLAKWEGKCRSSKIEAVLSSDKSCRSLLGPLNDIHNKLNFENIESFDKNTVHSLKSNLSIGVMPLPCYTNERYQVSQSELSEVVNVCPLQHDVISVPLSTHPVTNVWDSKNSTVNRNSQPSFLSNDAHPSNARMFQFPLDGRMVKGESSSQDLQKLTQISFGAADEVKGNVHSGAPPPWFDATEENQLNVKLKQGLNTFVSCKVGKSQKLNPRRVGAAWAEKRKIEMEMEKSGEIAANNYDADWLPNFGRVWQSGSRRESRKEFETEKQELIKAGSQSDLPIKIQPYISKRMRSDACE